VLKALRAGWDAHDESGLGEHTVWSLLTGWVPEHVPVADASPADHVSLVRVLFLFLHSIKMLT
jgi:hypothetical protein